jgi:hypothetical protein
MQHFSLKKPPVPQKVVGKTFDPAALQAQMTGFCRSLCK